MAERRRISLAEELGLLVEMLKEAEKEDVIQSYIFLIRDEGTEEVDEELDWELTQTAVASAKVSIQIDYLLDFNLLKYSLNPGYMLTEEGKKILLKNIPKDVKKKYNERIEKIADLGNNREIVRIAREKYLEIQYMEMSRYFPLNLIS